MRILIGAIMPARSYSGGRYHAWLMAEAFAALGHEVVFWTTNPPIFVRDFANYPNHGAISLQLTNDFQDAPEGPWDFVWIIPHKNPPHRLFKRALEIAREHRAKLGLLSYETPNWMEETAPQPVDHTAWAAWRAVAPCLDLVLASTGEGLKYARAWFGDDTRARYAFCNPPINDRAADDAKAPTKKRGARKHVVCITRFGGAQDHKGGREILDHAGAALTDCVLTFIVGAGDIPAKDAEDYRNWAEEHDVEIRLQRRASDIEKFRLLHEADLMIFLSRFEGFGYPPVEAQYCGLPCIVYELPVLREVSADALTYIPLDHPEALGPAIARLLAESKSARARLLARDTARFGFDAYCANLARILGDDAGAAAMSASLDQAVIDDAIAALIPGDMPANLDAGTGASRRTINGRIVDAVAKIVGANRALRRVFSYAVLHPDNLPRVLGDDDLSRLLFYDHKPLSLLIRRNDAFLKHLLSTPEAAAILEDAEAQGAEPDSTGNANDL